MASTWWADLASPDVGELLAPSPSAVGLLPVGATEQHGPHLPTGTDTIVASALCDAAASRTGAPVLPAIAVGCSYGHGSVLAGTLSISPEQLAQLTLNYLIWAAHSGLRRVLIVNAHFGNQAALSVAVDRLRYEHPELRAGVIGWWELDPRITAEVAADGDDVHANRAETSIMLAIAPQLVHRDRIADADDPDRTDDLVFRYTAESLTRNGVTGCPTAASTELGRMIWSLAVDALVERIERGRNEMAPLVGHRDPSDTVIPETLGTPA